MMSQRDVQRNPGAEEANGGEMLLAPVADGEVVAAVSLLKAGYG
jgi:hypothetical protein